jgi:hypothetical protein
MTRRESVAALGWIVALLWTTAALGAGSDDTKNDSRKAEAILRRMADFYKKSKSFTVDFGLAQTVGPTTMKTNVAATFARPNKLAIRIKGALLVGIDIFSDGKALTISIPAGKRYTVSKAPASISDMDPEDANQSFVVIKLQGSLLLELTALEPYQALTDPVKTFVYVGQEVVDGNKTEHVRCVLDRFEWEVWIAAEGDPVLRKVVMDMTRAAAKSPAEAKAKGPKVEMVATFKSWKIDPPPDDKAFAFEPPAGSQKVDSLEDLFKAD